MTSEVALQVTVDLEDPVINAKISQYLSEYAWATSDGIVTMTVFSEADPVSDAVRAIRCARAHGIEVLRVFEDPVNVGEISRRVGVSRQAVQRWTSGEAFPPALGVVGNDRPSPIWPWAEVVAWLKDARSIDMGEDLPDARTVAEINAHIHAVPDGASELMHAQIGQPAIHRVRRSASSSSAEPIDGPAGRTDWIWAGQALNLRVVVSTAEANDDTSSNVQAEECDG